MAGRSSGLRLGSTCALLAQLLALGNKRLEHGSKVGSGHCQHPGNPLGSGTRLEDLSFCPTPALPSPPRKRMKKAPCPLDVPGGTDLILGLTDQRRERMDAERIPARQPFPQLPAELLRPHAALLGRKRDRGGRSEGAGPAGGAPAQRRPRAPPNFKSKRHAATPEQTPSEPLSKRSYRLSLQATPTITIIERKKEKKNVPPLSHRSSETVLPLLSGSAPPTARVGRQPTAPREERGWCSFLMAFLKER